MRSPATVSVRPRRRHVRLLAVLALLTALFLPATAATAAEPVTMTARALVGGHVRVGAWSAVEVDLSNDGPAISGELRLGGGQPGASTYGALVDLPLGTAKSRLHRAMARLRARIEPD